MIDEVKGKVRTGSDDYIIEPLNDRQVNNFNFKFKMKDWKDFLVIRVEDRSDLSFEQELHSYAVSSYFGDDAGLFMMHFKSEDGEEIEYKPLVISQFANQGNLQHVAKKLNGADQATIASQAKHYFYQLNDFCLKLKQAKAYHPDIKLANFLVHNNKLLVSDRKTFTRSPNPRAMDIRSSPQYAAPQYLECLNDKGNDFVQPKARNTIINMEQYMAYQVGLALKEFLMLTQMDAIEEESWGPDRNTASFFQKPDRQIINLSLLVEELTRPEEGKRLSIEQFQRLLPYINHKPDTFYKQLIKELPSSTIGVLQDIRIIEKLLSDKNLKGKKLLDAANVIFNRLSEGETKEPRLVRLAEKLAIKCHKNYSNEYFSQISQSIETALLNRDWDRAPWYRQLLHVLTFENYRVDEITTVDQIDINIDFRSPLFQSHFAQLEFLPGGEFDSLGEKEASHFKEYIYAHLDDIKQQNSTDTSETSSLESSDEETSALLGAPSEPSKGKKADPVETEGSPEDKIESDTMVVRKVDPVTLDVPSDSTIVIRDEQTPPDMSSDGTIVIKDKKAITDHPASSKSVVEDEELSSTIVVKKEVEPEDKLKADRDTKSKKNHSSSRHPFFATEPEQVTEGEKLIYRRSIHRVNSTLLFRGQRSKKTHIDTPEAVENLFQKSN